MAHFQNQTHFMMIDEYMNENEKLKEECKKVVESIDIKEVLEQLKKAAEDKEIYGYFQRLTYHPYK